VLCDWEEAHEDAIPFEDAFHYLVQGFSLLHRPSRQQLLHGLRGEGWVGASLSAYAEAAGLSMTCAGEALREYLRVSDARLSDSTPNGRKGLEARRLLAEALGS
jgi:hypothetical protein